MCAKKRDIQEMFNIEKVYRVIKPIDELGLEPGDLFSVNNIEGTKEEILIYKGDRDKKNISVKKLKEWFDKEKVQ